MLREWPAEPGIEVYWDRREALVLVRADLNGPAAAALCRRLIVIDEVLGVLNGEPRRLIVDLAGVGFADQAAVHALAATRRRLQPGCRLLFRSPSWAARRVLAPSGLLDDNYPADGPVCVGRGQAWPPVRQGNSPDE